MIHFMYSYAPGHFSDVAKSISGVWLARMITAAAVISQTGLTAGAVLISDVSLQVRIRGFLVSYQEECHLIHSHVQAFVVRHYYEFFEAREKSKSKFVRWFFDVKYRVAPIFGQ